MKCDEPGLTSRKSRSCPITLGDDLVERGVDRLSGLVGPRVVIRVWTGQHPQQLRGGGARCQEQATDEEVSFPDRLSCRPPVRLLGHALRVYMESRPFSAVARDLNARGIPTKRPEVDPYPGR